LNNAPTWLWLMIFWGMQLIANLLFKFGSTLPSRWLPGFILGNVFGASSIYFMMKLYTRLNPNIANTIAGAGTFILVQLALGILFHSRPTPLQWVGIVAVCAGSAIVSATTPIAGK